MNPEIELRHLRYFIAVAEELHFSRAAKRLHIAQPPLSQQIRKLEQHIGHSLFNRNSRTVALTHAGETLLERARHLLKRIEEDMETVRRVGRGEMGSLTVGFIGSAMLTVLPALLGKYRMGYPQVELRLRELTTSRLIDAIRQGAVDIGFLRDAGRTEGLSVETVLAERFVVALPETHPLAARKKINLPALQREPLVLFPRELGPRAWDKTIELCETAGFRPKIVQEAPEWLTVLRLVSSGLGFSITPACVATIKAPGAVCRELVHCPISTDIELAHRNDRLNPIIDAFLTAARTAFQARRTGTSMTLEHP
ncbi:MAG TPA: LysR substrate-binding domain-containing protein [Chthoniobacterales bacterium]|nr:LysR substrate-binding domain-containing protein [Chthoniobacterales bacterium]